MTRWGSATTFAAAVLVLVILCLVLGGCKGRELEQARQQAREAKTTVATLELALARHVDEISKLKAELNAVKQTRDDLQEQVDGMLQEREKATELVEHAQEVITHLTARASGQASATAALQKQITDLKALVAEQQAMIEELQQTAAAGRITTETPENLGLEDEVEVPDVNEPVGDDTGR